jgi:hypothetical protein
LINRVESMLDLLFEKGGTAAFACPALFKKAGDMLY